MRTFAIIVVCLALVVWAIAFRKPSGVRYVITLPTAERLHDKAQISFKGIRIGHVEKLRLTAQGSVEATAVITNKDMHLLTGDSARISTTSLLGDDIIEIVRTAEGGAPLPAGSTIQAAKPETPVDLSKLLKAMADFGKLPPATQQEMKNHVRDAMKPEPIPAPPER